MRKVHILCVLALGVALALAACSEGDTVTAPATPVCGDGQCHLGETVLTCLADCGPVAPPPTAIAPTLTANHIPGTLIVQVRVSASPIDAIGAVVFTRFRAGVQEGSVTTEDVVFAWDLRGTVPTPCDTHVFSAEVMADQGYRVSRQPDDVTVTIPGSLCAV